MKDSFQALPLAARAFIAVAYLALVALDGWGVRSLLGLRDPRALVLLCVLIGMGAPVLQPIYRSARN